ncbi:hypothetical protein BDP81DRAFT_394100 [Colletotrichum phormii]|uniref:Uncharacterized protein n=1 Tax=Colletotrichum phormii TaxID=359342 RepID=A0AAJ0EHV5_9PEZI|nr:uncharacterized protein BDP81DRAFT_394100 [Colletotrichum phormii]KAK1637436.1 hypothetical protein BDP81DRAFT_394100 [Colletotrichum phormii]
MPIEELFRRGQCFSSVGPRPAPAGLPAIEINITGIVNQVRDIQDLPWTDGRGAPGHRWRWRAAGTSQGLPILQVQLYGYIGAHVELHATALRDGNRPAILVTPNGNINGGAAQGWGEPLCLSLLTNFDRNDITYVLHIVLAAAELEDVALQRYPWSKKKSYD